MLLAASTTITLAISLTATIVGVFAGGYVSWALQRSKQKHEQRTRWDERRVDLLGALFGALQGYGDTWDAIREEPTLAGLAKYEPLLLEAWERARDAWNVLELLTPDPLYTELSELMYITVATQKKAMAMIWAARDGDRQRLSDDLRQLWLDDFHHPRDASVHQVKAFLGVA